MSFSPLSSKISIKIYNINFVCACLVVSIHLLHPIAGTSSILDKILCGGIALSAVPIFFCISGYLIAPQIFLGNWMQEIFKRLKTLLIPFLVWGGISLIAPLPIAIFNDLRLHQPIGTTFFASQNLSNIIIGLLGLDLTKMPLAGPLWYLRNLLLLVIVSPGICWIVRKLHWFWIIGLFIGLILWCSIASQFSDAINGFLMYGFSFVGLIYFSLGILLRLQDCHFSNWYVTIFLLPICFFLWFIHTFIHPIPCLRPIITSCFGYTLWQVIPEISFPKVLIQSAFPIYLMHMIFLRYLQSFPRYIPTTSSVIGFLLHWLGPIVLSILLSFLLHKYFKKFSAFVFGRR